MAVVHGMCDVHLSVVKAMGRSWYSRWGAFQQTITMADNEHEETTTYDGTDDNPVVIAKDDIESDR